VESQYLSLTDVDVGDDADIIIWDLLTGEKVQVLSCAFNGLVGALVLTPKTPGLAPGFAFGHV
jgi:hypothetical protein